MNPEEIVVEQHADFKYEIKTEPIEDNKQYVQEDFKYEMPPEGFPEFTGNNVGNNDSDHTKKIDDKEEDQPLKEKKKMKKKRKKKQKVMVKEERNEFDYWNPLQGLDPGSNLELTEDFIFFILRQVDVLCENIRNGDPDQERTIEVNKNLNNAVNCYRSKLDLGKNI